MERFTGFALVLAAAVLTSVPPTHADSGEGQEETTEPAVTTEGVRGHLVVPGALSTPEGYVFFGFGSNTNQAGFEGQRQNSYLFNLGYLPGLEIGGRYTVFPDTFDPVVGGDFKDRSINAKLSTDGWHDGPWQAAIGATDLVGESQKQESVYGVVGRTLGDFRIDAGIGTERFSGPFAGATWHANEWLSLSGDFDTHSVTTGAVINPADWAQLTAGYSFGEGGVFGATFKTPLDRREPAPPELAETVPLDMSPFTGDRWAERIREKLVERGFENVRLTADEPVLGLEFENRRFVMPTYAYGVALVTLARRAPERFDRFTLTLLRNRTKLTTLRTGRQQLTEFLTGERTASEYARTLGLTWKGPRRGQVTAGRANSSIGHFDIDLLSAVDVQLGVQNSPFQHRDNIRLRERGDLLPHIQLDARQMLITQTTFPGEDEGDVVNERLLLQADYRVGGGSPLFLRAKAGRLTEEFDGATLEGRVEFSGGPFNAGVLGGVAEQNPSDTNREMALGYLGARVPQHNLELKLLGGQFIDEDDGIRFETYRRFGKHRIGFFAVDSDTGETEGGIRLLLGDPFYQEGDPETVRFQPIPLYPYQVTSTTDPVGRIPRTGGNLDTFLLRAEPDFIRNNLGDFRRVEVWMLGE